MLNMKILKASRDEFTGKSGGKPIRNIYRALEGADAMVLIDRNLTVLDSHTTRMAAPCVDMPLTGSSGSLTCKGRRSACARP